MEDYSARHIEAARTRGWAVLARLVALIGVLLAGMADTGPRGIRVRALRLLRPAEAMARRLLLLMAADRTAALRAPTSPFPPGLQATSEDRPPRFRLTEPLHANFAAFFRDEDAPSGEQAAIAGPIRASSDPISLTQVKQRFAALNGVLSAPDKAAGRMARWMGSRETRRRMLPIRASQAPACRSRHVADEVRSMLRHLNHLARIARYPP